MNQGKPLSLAGDSFDITEPFEGDQLGRDVLAKQLSGYIDRLKAGAVLGIDAPWGEGKSWFGRHWAKSLEGTHRVAFIDAFENDFVDDPFVLIASELSVLLDSPEGGGLTLRKKAAVVMKAIVPLGTKAIINFAGRMLTGTSDLSAELEDAAKGVTDDAADGASKWIEHRIESLATERASMRGFRTALAEATQKCDHPVVVLVDELDRCKPTFAVTLIERIKHLFDVPNLVFVLLLNRRQLEVAIEGQYGAGTDGQAYLGKFVNLWFELPRSDGPSGRDRYESYVAQRLGRYGFDQQPRSGVDAFKAEASAWARAFEMSLRDIDRMCALFVLAGRPTTSLLVYVIALKVKFPRRFSALRRNSTASHMECAQALMALVPPGSGGPLNGFRWPEALFVGLAELHQVVAGTMPHEQATTLNKDGQMLVGRLGSLDGCFVAVANWLDFPIESY